MSWKPLPEDIPLDHEALQPEQQAMGADAPPAEDGLTPLPPDAPLDNQEPPPIATHVRAPTAGPDIKAQDATPTYTEKGFDVAADPTYHASLSDEDKAEYATFFTDPNKPPTAEFLRRWFHQKTGAHMGNADEVIDRFKQDGKFSTNQNVVIPTKSGSSMDAYGRHLANSILGDWGAEVSAPVAAVLPGGDRPTVFNSEDSFGDIVSQNADLTRGQLDRDTADHPVASPLGEVSGVLATIPVGGEAANLARLEKLGETGRAVAAGTVGGGVYGSGAAGPGHRLEGGGTGAVVAPLVGTVAKLPVASYRVGQTVLTGSPGLARRIIAKAIKDDANMPETVGQDIAAAHANDVPMALADTGENTRGLLAATSRTSGMARTIARDALEERQAGLADRVTKTIERDLGPVANPHKVADDLMTKARDDAAPIYDSFYSARPTTSEAVDNLVSRPSMQKALKNAYRIAQEEGRDPESLGFRLGADGKVVLEPGPTLSMTEAQKASPNRFSEVLAPDEYDQLAVRTFTGRSGRKIKIRGPIDITQSIRLMGGIRDEGGNLKSMGLSNAPRRMPFGSNEQFLGKLIDNERGVPLDEATERLWEEGYFPEFPERPTINDLINRLGEEHSGSARYFHPGDFAEVSDFEKARFHRFSTEEAKASGAPRSEDITRPSSGIEDAVARSGPAVAGRGPLREKVYSPQTLDYLKRGMDDVVEAYRDPVTGKLNLDTEGRAVNNTLRSYLGVVDNLYPDYAKARAAYAGPVKGIAAMNTGRKFLSQTADDIEARMRDMSPFEKQMAALGTRRAMAELVASKGDSADVVHALVGTGKKRAMLARLFGDRKQFQRFVETLGQEREGFRTFKQALLGSPTAPNLADDSALEAATTAAELMVHGGLPVATAMRKSVKFLGREISDKVKQQIAAMLSDTNPARIRELAAELRAQAVKRGLRIRRTNAATNAVGKSAVVFQPQRQ